MIKPLAGALVLGSLTIPALGQDNPRALLEKAISAHGGERLGKARTLIRAAKGEIDSFPQPVPFTAEVRLNLPEQARWYFELQKEQKAIIVLVVNRDKGWRSSGGAVKDLTPREVADMREEAYVAWLTTLLPLLENQFDLSPLPEIKVNGEPAAGIKVASKGRPDVKLYFDRKTALLVKVEFRGHEADLVVDKEQIFSAFKEFDGARLPTKIQVLSNGKRVADWNVTSYRFVDRFDDTAFAKP